MAKFTFYRKAGSGNYYLTKCEPEPGDISITLPDYVCYNNIIYTYGIYSYAFWGNLTTTHLIIPETVDALLTNCFAGSNVETVELQMQRPPRRPESLLELSSLQDCITFIYPIDRRSAYENKGWVNQQVKNTIKVRVIENRTIIDKDRTQYPSLYRSGIILDQVIFSNKTTSIEPMAFLGTKQSVEHAEEPMFIFDDKSYDNISYNFNTGKDIIDNRNQKQMLVKGGQIGTVLTGQILGPNCFYNNTILSNTRTMPIKLVFHGTRIEDFAFQACRALGQLTIDSSIEYIADNAFWGCQSLSSIVINDVKTDKQIYHNKSIQASTQYNLLYTLDSDQKMQPIWFSPAIMIDVTIPTKATTAPAFYTELLYQIDEIPAYLFKNSGLQGVLTIPKNIKKIHRNAFQNCVGLTRVICEDRPDGSKLVIDEFAFDGCKNIAVFTYPNTEVDAGFRALSSEGEDEKRA